VARANHRISFKITQPAFLLNEGRARLNINPVFNEPSARRFSLTGTVLFTAMT
jgi:hypothetical protein